MEAAPVMKQAFSIFSGTPPVSPNLAQASERKRPEGRRWLLKRRRGGGKGWGGACPKLRLKERKGGNSLSVAVSQAGG